MLSAKLKCACILLQTIIGGLKEGRLYLSASSEVHHGSAKSIRVVKKRINAHLYLSRGKTQKKKNFENWQGKVKANYNVFAGMK
jgi:hypothetical protein